jgi:hypothetical protein
MLLINSVELLTCRRQCPMFPQQLRQILGQAVGAGADGADSGPEGSSLFVDIRELVQSGRPRTLWPELLDDLLGKR